MQDKTAIRNAAQKFASNGNTDMAIAEWEKLLENGKDGNVQNTIGDLYMRKGTQAEAIKAFTEAAEIFRKDGFYPKSIAIYKKILNIHPNSVETIIALAKLNVIKGMDATAANYYFMAADLFHKNGYAEKATATVENILRLSTVDQATREKIAAWHIKAGMKPRAANEYAAIASNYLEKDDILNAGKFFTRAAELDPDNISAFTGLSKLAEKTGEIDLAFKHLEDAISKNPDSKEALIAYSELAIRNNKPYEAKETLLKLIEKAPSYNPSRKLLGGLYLNENETEKAWEQLLPCIDDAVSNSSWADAIKMLNNFRELHPVSVKERIIAVHRSANDRNNLIKELKELADLHEEQSSKDKALKLYKELFDLEPDNTEITDKIKELESPAEIKETDEHADEKPMPAEEPPENEPGSYSDALIEKRKEAEFYAKQGMNEEAVTIYKEILNFSPDNAEIKKRLEELQTASIQSEEVVVEKMYDEEADTKDKSNTSSTTQDLQIILDKFSKNKGHEDHYKAGLECRLNGHLDNAVKEFKIAADDPEKWLVSKSMIALCYIEKGAYADAVTEFTQILEAMSPEDASYPRIKYELANAYEKNGNKTKALELYSEIKEQNPDFKDINIKIENITSIIKKSEKPENKSNSKKRNRVSYI